MNPLKYAKHTLKRNTETPVQNGEVKYVEVE
jgi:hypothetical protein